MRKKRGKAYLLIMAFILFMVQGGNSILSPRIVLFAQEYPDVPYANILLLVTIVNLMCVAAGFLVGPLQKRLGLRRTVIFFAFLFVAGGMLPLINTAEFNYILATRFVCGIGFGGLFAICANFVVGYFRIHERQRVLGIGGIASSIGLMFFSLGGALISAPDLHNIWFIHLIEAVPLVMALFLNEAEEDEEYKADTAAEGVAGSAAAGKKKSIPGVSWILIMIFAIIGICHMSMFLYASNIIVDNGFGTAFDASLVNTVMALAGIGFSLLYTIFGRKISAKAGMLIGHALFLGSTLSFAFADSLFWIYLGSCCAQGAFLWYYSSMTYEIARITPKEKVPTANGLAISIHNIFAFFASNVMLALLGVFGHSGDLQFAFIITTVIYIVMTLVIVIKVPAERKKTIRD